MSVVIHANTHYPNPAFAARMSKLAMQGHVLAFTEDTVEQDNQNIDNISSTFDILLEETKKLNQRCRHVHEVIGASCLSVR